MNSFAKRILKLIPLLMATLYCLTLLGQAKSPANKSKADCGLHCLYASLVALTSDRPSLIDLEKELGPPEAGGYSLLALKQSAERHGLQTLGVKTTTSALRRRPDQFTCIAAVDGDHFVVLTEVKDGVVTMIDGARVVRTEEAVFMKRWSGEALLLSANALTPESEIPREWPWRAVIASLAFLGLSAWGGISYYRRR
jgi:ABC-type bacteriocin/lantibiotic exporter with double-glycine peptidase domain